MTFPFPCLAVFLSFNFVFCFWQKSYFKSLSGLVWRKLCAGSEFPVISAHHSHSWGVTGVQGTNPSQSCCSFFKYRDLQESKSSFCLMFAFMQLFLQLNTVCCFYLLGHLLPKYRFYAEHENASPSHSTGLKMRKGTKSFSGTLSKARECISSCCLCSSTEIQC